MADTDPFDRIYSRWAEHAKRKRLKPPSREKWDAIVLRLILSEDPERISRYRHLEDKGPEGLGADAYELWDKMPDYTPNRTVSPDNWPDFQAYEEAHHGSMKRLMGEQGLLDKYRAIIEAQEQPAQEPAADKAKVKARQAQRNVVMLGCIGMTLIAFMMLTVLLIIVVQMGT